MHTCHFTMGTRTACSVNFSSRERCACIHAVSLDPLNFSHQDPIPEAVKPSRGPKAGGTLITISGRFLDTGSKEDVQVTVGGVSCIV